MVVADGEDTDGLNEAVRGLMRDAAPRDSSAERRIYHQVLADLFGGRSHCSSIADSLPRDRGSSLCVEPKIGRYIVLAEAGWGAMGRVLRVYDPKLKREVALKELRLPADLADGGARLISEARAMAKLSHPNVVTVYDVEEIEPNRWIFTMEYVAGMTLASWLGDADCEDMVLQRFLLAGRGLAAAHAVGVLHRDFKPANVLIGVKAGSVKVADFGLAQQVSPLHRGSPGFRSEGERSASEAIVGTPRYMAPEQHLGHKVSAQADQYAFCVALWEALERKPPFVGENVDEILKRKLMGPPAWRGSGLSPRQVAAIRRGLCPQPRDRWPDMHQLLGQLATTKLEYKRMGGWVMSGSLAVCCGVGSHMWLDPSHRCEKQANQLVEVWDGEIKDQLREKMLAIDVPYATAIQKSTEDWLDHYADNWTKRRVEICEATLVRAEQSHSIMKSRSHCLFRGKLALDEAVGVLMYLDDDRLKYSADIVAMLPRLEPCSELVGLNFKPLDPGDDSEKEKIWRLIAASQFLRKADYVSESLSHIENAILLAEDVGDDSMGIEVLLEYSHVLEARGDYSLAEHNLRMALYRASEDREWALMRTIAQSLARIVGVEPGRASEGWQYYEIAKGLAGSDPGVYAALAHEEAEFYKREGNLDRAMQEYRRALRFYQRVLNPPPLVMAGARRALAGLLAKRGRSEEAASLYAMALMEYDQSFGPLHPTTQVVRREEARVIPKGEPKWAGKKMSRSSSASM